MQNKLTDGHGWKNGPNVSMQVYDDGEGGQANDRDETVAQNRTSSPEILRNIINIKNMLYSILCSMYVCMYVCMYKQTYACIMQ